MKLITYHYYKSTGVGGVESLIKHLQNVSLNMKWKVEEIFHGISGEEIYAENSEVIYSKMPSNEGRKNIFLKIYGFFSRRLRTYQFFSRNFNKENNVAIFFHPALLHWVPNKFLTKNKVILIQTNKVDVYFNFLGRIGFVNNIENIDNITVYTQADKSKLLTTYPKLNLENKIKIIPRACRFSTTPEVADFSNKLVSIARIDEAQKNFTSMCKVMSLLPASFTLDIYGAGLATEIAALKEKIKNEPRISFKGVTTTPDIVLRKYSLFMMTSHFEGFGQTLIEARSQGLPIVAFNTFEALSSIVENGYNGFFIKPYEHNNFSEAIQTILSKPHIYDDYSMNSINKSTETQMDLVSQLWVSIISKNNKYFAE
jgi:glycosyltransferase involved in cell wall biosynthesis